MKILSSIGRRSCEIIMKEKTPLSHHGHTKLCAFICLISRPQILNLRYRNQVRVKLLFFLKTRSLQRELFLTMFYTINLSTLLVIKKGFMIIIFWVITNSVHCACLLQTEQTKRKRWLEKQRVVPSGSRYNKMLYYKMQRMFQLVRQELFEVNLPIHNGFSPESELKQWDQH